MNTISPGDEKKGLLPKKQPSQGFKGLELNGVISPL